jgi:hypothetical protein
MGQVAKEGRRERVQVYVRVPSFLPLSVCISVRKCGSRAVSLRVCVRACGVGGVRTGNEGHRARAMGKVSRRAYMRARHCRRSCAQAHQEPRNQQHPLWHRERETDRQTERCGYIHWHGHWCTQARTVSVGDARLCLGMRVCWHRRGVRVSPIRRTHTCVLERVAMCMCVYLRLYLSVRVRVCVCACGGGVRGWWPVRRWLSLW